MAGKECVSSDSAGSLRRREFGGARRQDGQSPLYDLCRCDTRIDERLDGEDLQPKLPVLASRLSVQLRNVISVFERQRGGRRLPVLIARQNIDGTEVEFNNMLIEDLNKSVRSPAFEFVQLRLILEMHFAQ